MDIQTIVAILSLIVSVIGVVATVLSILYNVKNKIEVESNKFKSVFLEICIIVVLAIIAIGAIVYLLSNSEKLLGDSSYENNSFDSIMNSENVSMDGVSSSISDYSSRDNDISKDEEKSDSDDSDSYTSINDEIDAPEPSSIPLKSVHWIEEEKIHRDMSATTTRGEEWIDCIGFGSNNLNTDGNSHITVVCDKKYNIFTAEIAPQDGFDSSREVTLYFYSVNDGEYTVLDYYNINNLTEPHDISIDISDVNTLCIEKKGDYSPSVYALQYINGYRGMCVLMRDATLHKE